MASPLEKILTVFECVAQDGPITLAELNKDLPFSRASIWRMLNILRSKGWVRMKLGRCEYVVCERLVRSVKLSDCDSGDLERISSIVKSIIEHKIGNRLAFHVQYGYFVGDGQFDIVEDSSKDLEKAHENYAISLAWENIAIAAQAYMPGDLRTMHVNSYLKIATGEEAQAIVGGSYTRRVKSCRETGYDYCGELDQISIPTFPMINKHGALRISKRKDINLDSQDFIRIVGEKSTFLQ